MNFPTHSLRSKGRILAIDQPLVMGILNATPDSFFENSRVNSLQQVVDVAGKMLDDGAAIFDIGGQSTRPGAVNVTAEEEAQRVLPAVEAVKKAFPESWISIDTFYASVAEGALSLGADLVNDISAGEADANMFNVVSTQKVPFVAMHKQGVPQNMQANPHYENVTAELLSYFLKKKTQLETENIFDWILDPGFGFGKTLEHNYTLMNDLGSFGIFSRPVMVGISRKGMVQKALGVTAAEALNGTTALHMVALQKGAAILRVHDVKEAVECITLHRFLQNSRF